MKMLTLMTCILIFQMNPLQAQVEPETKKSSKSSFFSRLFYDVKPLLSDEEITEFEEELALIRTEIQFKTNLQGTLKDSIFNNVKLDTVKIPSHFSLFRGYINIPKLTEMQEAASDIKVKISKVNQKINSLKTEERKILRMFKRNKKYMEKNILLGFIQWDSKKDSTQLNQ